MNGRWGWIAWIVLVGELVATTTNVEICADIDSWLLKRMLRFCATLRTWTLDASSDSSSVSTLANCCPDPSYITFVLVGFISMRHLQLALSHAKMWLVLWQNDLIIEMPRRRKQVARYGKQDEAVHISDLETSGSDADYDEGTLSLSQRGGRRKKRGGRHGHDYDDGSAMMSANVGEGYSRSDCFNVEKLLLVFGYNLFLC